MNKVSGNVRNKVMDELHDDPGSILEVAAAIEMSQRIVRACFYELEAEGLIEPYMKVTNTNGTISTIYRMARTKKSNVTELGPVAA